VDLILNATALYAAPMAGLYTYTYPAYFAACAPSRCEYTLEGRMPFVNVLTATLGEVVVVVGRGL
jgi:hypothetical protein